MQNSASPQKLKIALVCAFYSEGMGYSENCLSRALAKLGHEVHVITSTYNVYGNESMYEATYSSFLGPAQVGPGTRTIDGYTLHRLPSTLVGGYVRMPGLTKAIREIAPNIVHTQEVASLQTWELAVLRARSRFKLFTETRQTMSVMRPYMREPRGALRKRLAYRLTRTVPTAICSLAVERCYALTPDCGEVAQRFYGVPAAKIRILSLGADTETFHPVASQADQAERNALRASLGFEPGDIVCLYTGRFTHDKNPLVLAKAIDTLSKVDSRYKGLFIGDGEQKAAIAANGNVTIRPFMSHGSLSAHYRAADIGIWPRQESMSMIDAASSGVPLIVSDRIGEPERVRGNGRMYEENNVESLIEALRHFGSGVERQTCGEVGRKKMLASFSWKNFAETIALDFHEALRR
jgi:glycosyltransferase involved in cell wall biosynthesis